MSPGAAVPVAASTALAGLLWGEPRATEVLGSSPSALYLGVAAGEGEPAVVGVVGLRSVRLPCALVTAAAAAPRVDVSMSPVIGGGALRIGDARLYPARWFDPRPRLRGDLDSSAARRALAALAEANAFAGTGCDVRQAMDVAVVLRDGGSGEVERLLGRGPGLTPSGDDVLAGALAALALAGALDGARAAALLDRARLATTALSAALLDCAMRGQVIPQAAAVLHALDGSGDLGDALVQLLRVGATSGAALALGLLAGVQVAHAASVSEAVR